MSKKKKKNRRNKKPSRLPSTSAYFFCTVRGMKLPADPRVCDRCKKRCKERSQMMATLAFANSGMTQVRLPTAPPTKVEPSGKEYDRKEDKKKVEQKAMEIALESYEED